MFDKFREECGVFGIYGHSEAANMAYLGLYALQHRGQESAGIAVSDGVQRAGASGDGLRRGDLHPGRAGHIARPHRHRPHPLLDGR